MTEKGTLANAINDYYNRHETSADKARDEEIAKIDEKLMNENNCEVEDSEPNLLNKNGEMDFVKAGNNDILRFIQKNIRKRNNLEKELKELKKIYDNLVLKTKARLMSLEEVKTLGTGKEREAKVQSMLKDEIKENHELELSLFENNIANIKNELDLAREIYRLKNI